MPKQPRPWAVVAAGLSPEFVDRFWSKVDKRGPDECWPWTGARSVTGYGMLSVPGLQAPVQAHRVACGLATGSVQDGRYVCHSCDNPGCCNPAHLWIGTHRENMHDMHAKGRNRNGRELMTHCKRGHLLPHRLGTDVAPGPCARCVALRCEAKRRQTEQRWLRAARADVEGLLPATADELVERLGRRRAAVLRSVYALYGAEHMTMEEVGAALGCSRQRVEQVRDAAVRRLRALAAAQSARRQEATAEQGAAA